MPVLARYLLRIHCTVRSEYPVMLAISGTVQPASASMVKVARREALAEAPVVEVLAAR